MASPAIAIKIIRSPQRQTLLARFRDAYDEVKRSVEGPVKKQSVEIAEDIVSNWENPPKFVASLYIDEDKISLYVEPTGPNAKKWEWTSRGTPAHLIAAGTRVKGGVKNKLLFKANYTPKTAPGPTWGGPGKASGPWVSKRVVKHPGTKPRKFEEYIGKQIKADFKREVENAFRRGVRKAG